MGPIATCTLSFIKNTRPKLHVAGGVVNSGGGRMGWAGVLPGNISAYFSRWDPEGSRHCHEVPVKAFAALRRALNLSVPNVCSTSAHAALRKGGPEG